MIYLRAIRYSVVYFLMTIVNKDTIKISWRQRILRLIRSAAIVYLLVVVCMMFLEESLIFFPSKYPEGDWRPWGLSFEDAWFQAADGTKLHGWYVASSETSPLGRRSFFATAMPETLPIVRTSWKNYTTPWALRS